MSALITAHSSFLTFLNHFPSTFLFYYNLSVSPLAIYSTSLSPVVFVSVHLLFSYSLILFLIIFCCLSLSHAFLLRSLFCILGLLSGLLAASFEQLRDVVTKAFIAIPRNVRPLVGTYCTASNIFPSTHSLLTFLLYHFVTQPLS